MIEDKIKYNDYWERVQEKDKEIEKLNNNWNKLERFICDLEIEFIDDNVMWGVAVIIHNKLKELKGSESNDKQK